MDSNSSSGNDDRVSDDIVEHAPESKRGSEGQAAHGGDQAGPNSADSGEPRSPQTGEPIEHSH